MLDRKYIFFDLDGTLIDSEPGIIHCVQYALSKMGAPAKAKEQLRPFIGPPLTHSFMRFSGMTEQQAIKATAHYRELYREKGIYMFKVYEGVEQMLKSLQDSGKILILATSKPEQFAKLILEKTKLNKYFSHICGSLTDNSRATKTEVLQFAVETAKAKNIDSCIMVGDREYDVLGAKDVNMQCIGVLYGYGSEEELINAGAVCLAKTPQDITDILLNNQ